ncbi:Ig-like domain-containing protein, partial [Pseudomonas sp. ok266]|uniref:Ig-like domain-containing protein n=1 Tax=Pseudomonas sp. ok266 TaxID=1761896 RepID=UPI0008AF34B0
IGEPTRLPAPIAIDQISGALDPNAPEYRICIPYDPLITPENAIELKWFGTRPDLTTYDPELDWYFPSEDEANDPNGFIITVEGKHGKTLEGGTLHLSYNRLADENGTITRRASLHASLLNVGEAQRELVKPIVLGEKDGVLEPKDLPGGASKITAPRPVPVPSEANDIVKYFCIVEGNEPVTDSKKLNALSKDKNVDFPLNAAFVAQHFEPNREKKMQVHYEIFRAASNRTSYSNVLEFVIGEPVALDPPTIDSVKGSPSGKDIDEGGTTVETSVVLSGTGAKGKNVEIRDGAIVKDQVTADPVSGIWTYTASGLTVTKHSFTATGKYGAEPSSAAYTLTVTAVIVPTLSNVLDDRNKEVPEGTSTFSTSLILKGSASKGQDVEAFDGNGSGAVSKGKATADQTTGLWECTIEVAVGARRLYVKSLYHPRSTYSNVRLLTVETLRAPTLSSVKGSLSDNEIPENGFTVETAVILSGVAAAGRDVEVLDGTDIKGKETADGVTGIWSLPIANLSNAKHSFTARYVEQPTLVSAARTLTVTQATAPTLTSVKGSPSDIEIPEGAETTETAVTLSGAAAKGQKVEVFDGIEPVGTPQADAKGAWNWAVSNLKEEKHSFTAQALYGEGQISEPARTLTVISELIVDTSPLNLNQLNYSIDMIAAGWLRTGNDPAGTSETRTVSGGLPPYSFTTNAPQIASVDGDGCIRSEGNGEAVITVSDALGQTKTITVKCSNVRRVLISPNQMVPSSALAWIDANGTRLLTSNTQMVQILKTKYFSEISSLHYTGATSDPSWPWTVLIADYSLYPNGQYIRHTIGTNTHPWPAMTLQR